MPAIASLGAQYAALVNLTERLRHPHRAVLYGDFVRGDDAPSPATCPQGEGLSPESCEVERMPGDVTGPWQTDGVEMTDNGCQARAHARGARIRSKLTCSNVHVRHEVVDPSWHYLLAFGYALVRANRGP